MVGVWDRTGIGFVFAWDHSLKPARIPNRFVATPGHYRAISNRCFAFMALKEEKDQW